MAEWRNQILQEAASRPRRSVGVALWRGFRGGCPTCGNPGLFRTYLKPVDNCRHCGEDMSHQRADDAPPYFTMVLVGHIIVPVMLAVAMRTELSSLTQLMIWLPLALAMTLALLQPIKGATIALQWALYMHGFDGRADPDSFDEGTLSRNAG